MQCLFGIAKRLSIFAETPREIQLFVSTQSTRINAQLLQLEMWFILT
jgi:hypothetical protein